MLHWNLRTSMSSIFLSQLKKISEMNICLLNIGFYSWEVNVPFSTQLKIHNLPFVCRLWYLYWHNTSYSNGIMGVSLMTAWLLALVKWPSLPVAHPIGLQEQEPSWCYKAMLENFLRLKFLLPISGHAFPPVLCSLGKEKRTRVQRLSHGLKERKVN